MVWKARYYTSFETQSDIRRGITMFYAKFCKLKIIFKKNIIIINNKI